MDTDIILQRLTDKEVQKVCDALGLSLDQITPHQLRIGNLLDFYPKRNRYFMLKQKRWGTIADTGHLYKVLGEVLPELGDTPQDTFKQWYLDLCKQPHSERMDGQLTMITSVLKVLLPEQEFKELTETDDE